MYKSGAKKIRVRKNDEHRALLTETLPYEVPILFSSEGLYLAAKNGVIKKIKEVHGLDIFKDQATIPYRYKIRKNSYEPRELAVMHPAQQLSASNFYSQYDNLIIGLCQRSPFTLRAPNSIASYYVESSRSAGSEVEANSIEEDVNGLSAVPKTGTSYFAYRKYPFIYRFYDSVEFLGLEKKFKFLSKMDVSDCFGRIYTHTIAWAVKNKKHAKKNKDFPSFEKRFDKLIQNSNHGETAGIIIGPEMSRIFAEIILQRIDLDIVREAESQSLTLDVDYTIRRYVDDYFVYSNTEVVREKIKGIISEALSEYNLAINHSKTHDLIRPYISGTSISRHGIATSVSTFFDKHIEFITEINEEKKKSKTIKLTPVANLATTSTQTIAAIKRSIGEGGVYDTTANYFFGTFKRLLKRMEGKTVTSEIGLAENNLYFFLSSALDIVFFYYSMTLRVRQTYQVSEIILITMRLMKGAPADLKDLLTRRVINESRLIIAQANADMPQYRVEVMNLLIVLRSLGESYVLERELLGESFGFEIKEGGGVTLKNNLEYFDIVFLFSYIGGISGFDGVIEAISRKALDRFESRDWFESAENVFIFFDLLSCPYLDREFKTDLAKTVLRQKSDNDLNNRTERFLEDVTERLWFFAWNQNVNIGQVLWKKELRSPY